MEITSEAVKYILFIGFAWVLLFQQTPFDKTEFTTSENSQVLQRIEIDASGHVYPYTATAVTFSCLLVVLVVIIVCGVQLGVIHDVLEKSSHNMRRE